MNLPSNFQWVEPIATKMIQEAIKIYGIKEIKGAANNPEIMKAAKELYIDDIYTSDDKQAWCAVIHNALAVRAGKKIKFTDRYDYLRAAGGLKLGVTISKDDWEVISLKMAMFGDTLIFKRPGGHHEAIYIGESSTHFYVFGGNQNDQYGFTRMAKERLIGVRRPRYKNIPLSVKKYYLSDTGVPVTNNES